MSKENRKLLKYSGIIFITVLLTYRLPHDSYSIVQYLIPPIIWENSVIYLSGIVPLALFIVGMKGLFKLERFAGKSKLLIFIAVVLIFVPAMNGALDFSRTNYHSIKGDGLEAVDIEESNMSINSTNDEMVISINLKLKDYSRKENKFKIRVYLPESISAYTGSEFYDLDNDYYTHGNRGIYNVQEEITIKSNNNHEMSQLFDSRWYQEDMEYELYNGEETVKIIKHGL